MSAPALLALLCLTQAAPPREVEASADALTLTPSTGAMDFRGHASLREGTLTLWADTLTYDPTLARATAEGDVVFADGKLGGTALKLDVDLHAQTGTFAGATLFQKAHATAAQVAAARTPWQMRLLDKNELTLRADIVRRVSPARYEAEGLYLTPCDCAAPGFLTEPPSWSVRARRATIAPGESVRLAWAELYIKDVPILPVPVLLLPLSNRQTGFLLPKPNYTARNGFQVEEPFFWAISRSWDVTFTPGYFFGETHLGQITENGALVDDPSTASNPYYNSGMAGPRLGTELRYAPSLTTRGRFDLALVEDLKPEGTAAHRNLRGELSGSHVQDLGAGFSDRVDIAAVSDERYFSDVTAEIFAAQQSYLRSDARVDHRSDSTDAYLATSYYQSLGAPAPDSSLGPFFGPRDVNRDTFQRLPAFALAAEEQGLGPLRLSADVDGVRYAPLGSRPAEELSLASAREVDERIGVQPELRLPLRLGRFAELAPYVIGRADAWQAETPDQPTRARAFALAGATLQTELSRTFGPEDGVHWRHVITPVVEVRGMPGSVGQGPDLPNDEFDAPIAQVADPAGAALGVSGRSLPAMLQGVAALRTRLDRRDGVAASEPLRAEIGQGYDFARRAPGDSYATASLQIGPLQTSGLVRYDIEERRLAGFAAHAGWTTPTGSTLSVGYVRLRSFLTDPMRAGLFDLVGPPPTGGTGVLAERLDVNGHWRASTELAFDLGTTFLPYASGLDAFTKGVGSGELSPAWTRLLAYTAGVTYGSACDCWGFRLSALFQPTPSRPFTPASFFFLLDAHRLGGSLGG